MSLLGDSNLAFMTITKLWLVRIRRSKNVEFSFWGFFLHFSTFVYLASLLLYTLIWKILPFFQDAFTFFLPFGIGFQEICRYQFWRFYMYEMSKSVFVKKFNFIFSESTKVNEFSVILIEKRF